MQKRMIDIVQQTLVYFLQNGKAPDPVELQIVDPSLLERQGSVFVTLYHNGELCGSAGGIKPIEENLAKELIEASVSALVNDERFERLSEADLQDLNIRIDLVESEVILSEEEELIKLEPKKLGVIAIKKDYSNMAVILPNIATSLSFGKDFPKILGNKLGGEFIFADHIVYKLETAQTMNF